MNSYDDWKTTDPTDDEDYRMPPCASRGCENRVTFDWEAFCSACLVKFEQQKKEALKGKGAA